MGIIGNTPALLEVLWLLEKAAPSNSNILFEAETGGGKELFAKLVARLAGEMTEPEIVDCTTLQGDLDEVELFGQEYNQNFPQAPGYPKIGSFERAHGKTLFLDELGKMPYHFQPRLLRVMQERKVRRKLGVTWRPASFRLVAATSQDLRQLVSDGTFYRDLYYRINVVTIRIPPLRERVDDIPLLIEHFLKTIAAHAGRKRPVMSKAVVKRLCAYSWPGNIRQLQNEMERLIILYSGQRIELEYLSSDIREAQEAAIARGHNKAIAPEERTLDEIECEAVKNTLAAAGTISGAARILGVDPGWVRRRMKKWGIPPP